MNEKKSLYGDENFTYEDMPENVLDLNNKKKIRKSIENLLEYRRLKKEVEDLEIEFNFDDEQDEGKVG